ncbi:HesA/MoeB/ThiF family protein [Nitrosomonas sp. Is37]|uniref:HesA/MoeB/ThiF family protein n=1 Tax=Nitrosomonas sp. Is37 TaxID=3080535 RepID=UPI00294B805E|nr:HesA/MoeB/ThiF family protein [Nitrosomonas sp. Is37]MDV6344966.1 HesA/MoeB/ThiF family protein [Nitrosomonas sp. Is37]
MNDSQLLRYSRHILLPQIDVRGQEKLTQSCVLIVGAGGLGSPAALYLAASGIGKIVICDKDNVDLTNLQRQIIHYTDAIGEPKTTSARRTLHHINPEVEIITLQEQVTEEMLVHLLSSADAVVDASDNFATRHAINQACIIQKKPLISGAVMRFDGQVSVFDLRYADNPCYHCLFPLSGEDNDPNCAVMGVFAPLAGIIGCTQAAETIKVLLGIGETLSGRLLLLDGLTMKWRTINLKKDPACEACSPSAAEKNNESW